MRNAALLLLLGLAPIAVSGAAPDRGQANASPARTLPNTLFIVSDDHGWEICRPIGTKPRCDFRRWKLWPLKRGTVSELPHRPALRTVSRLHVYRSILD